jgi:Rhamnosyl O-methyltransferase/CmcI
MKELREVCEEAFAAGSGVDLSGCHYGPHSRTGRYYELIPYYYLLAGLPKLLGLRSALDIGTHYGGSAMSISRGMEGKGTVVTVDITFRNKENLLKFENIKRVCGDSLKPEIAEKISYLLPEGAEMIYIDSFHDYYSLMRNIDLYSKLSPRYIVMDDIRINDSMKRAWLELQTKYATFDATDLTSRNCGFGVLEIN